MTEWQYMQSLIPSSPSERVEWDKLSGTALVSYIGKMQSTMQHNEWHGEGDVWTHTRMVVEALLADGEYWTLQRRGREILFMAALMHDIGKPACTVLDEGIWKSPKHTSIGASIARDILWTRLGMSGTQESVSFRESVCTLIRYHGMPLHLGERGDPERELIAVASHGECARDFSVRLLLMLVRADVRGRIADDIDTLAQDVEYAALMAEELDIMDKPYDFPSALTKRAYLSGRNVARDFALYDNTWGEVIMMAGLPGTGKDYYIAREYPKYPVISLDDIRRELKILPTDKDGQGVVLAEAKERARALLREHKPFVWNATDITSQLRSALIELFEKYGAKTHIKYLEAPLDVNISRNAEREHSVPESVIYKLLSKTEPPTPTEAHLVEWVSV